MHLCFPLIEMLELSEKCFACNSTPFVNAENVTTSHEFHLGVSCHNQPREFCKLVTVWTRQILCAYVPDGNTSGASADSEKV